jgi:hypothetical protein
MTTSSTRSTLVALFFCCFSTAIACADVGDPQVRTDHPWYPGELACSTFDRLFATQAAVYKRVTGREPITDEQKALAAWLWRCTHYFHGEEGNENLWGQGFTKGEDLRTREYWTGQFAHGFSLCGTTHSQWVAEMEVLFGHGRGRGLGATGHNTFEVFLTGGPYGKGRWVLLDHDLCTVIYGEDGKALLSMKDVARDWKRLTDRSYYPERQHGWPICGLHPDDAAAYAEYGAAEYLAGYSGPPPMVHLRRGERLRRYLQPGLADGKTFVFWGRNYNAGAIPGPERPQTWINEADRMYRSTKAVGYKQGRARYANAEYVYTPNFSNGDYREGILAEDGKRVVFEFQSPYIIAATPPNKKPWGVYDAGCKNGLVLHGKADCTVSVSVDCGKTWHDGGTLRDGLDLTDLVKGYRQYQLALHSGAKALAKSGLTITTVCQASAAMIPRLKDGGSVVSFAASGQAATSAGPTLPQAKAHLIDGKFESPRLTLEVSTPRGEVATAVYAAAHVRSGSPPSPDVKYQIEASTDGGKTWVPVVRDWTINRRGEEPKDFWSQSLCWGSRAFPNSTAASVQVRFRNDGGKAYSRAEAHLVYRVKGADKTKATFAWTDDKGEHKADHLFTAKEGEWKMPTGRNVQTRWVELEVVQVRP